MATLSVEKNGVPVTTVEQWKKEFIALKKKNDIQWKDGHSAKELAVRVLDGRFEKSLRSVLSANNSIVFGKAEFEKETKFDNFSSSRAHDLSFIGKIEDKKIAFSIEAKCDEDFYQTLNKAMTGNPEKSNKPARVDNLCLKLFGKKYDDSLGGIFYQLLYSVYGTVKYAVENNASEADFVVYQINSEPAKEKNACKKHLKAVNEFLQAVNPNLQMQSNSKVFLGTFDNIATYVVFIETE
ncbi:MAG: hypothetical protein II811_04915 [Spirochaetaceae bacterium]|nr:hypothetical protein [Spirochaetaceae bacterium]